MNGAKQLEFGDWKDVDKHISKTRSLVWNACFPILHTFLNQRSKRTFWWKKKLFCLKQGMINDARILYKSDTFDAELLDELTSSKEVDHIGYAFMNKLPKGVISVKKEELVQDVKAITKMEGRDLKPVRKDYNSFTKTAGFETVSVNLEHKPLILEFIEQWKTAMSSEFGFPVTCERDIDMINIFLGQKGIDGTVVLQKSKVVGIELSTYHPSNEKEYAISLMKKNLRVHRGLGTYLKVVQAQQLAEKGVKFINVAQADKERELKFKTKFMVGNSYLQDMYYYTHKFKPTAKKKLCINLLDKIWM